ncbi:MAG: ATP-binding protein [Chloroflexia bacterium]|nr:ATP-binding protein [Chloroflexia bacterium]
MTTRAPTLIRTHYTIGRAGEYFDARELAAQTGQHATAFARVALKELVDNGLDAAETAGVAPEIEIEIEVNDDTIRLRIGDNGPGLAPDVLERILDFNTRTSDKSRYRSPTRGAQGNALKTVIGIPTALGGDEPIIIEACGQRHTIRPRLDAAGNVDTGHEITSGPRTMGTQVELTLPGAGQELDPVWWARAFALSNRHATISVRITDHRTAIVHCTIRGQRL